MVLIRLKEGQTPIINSVIGKVNPGQTISVESGFNFDKDIFDVMSPAPEKQEVKVESKEEKLSGTVEVEDKEEVEEKKEDKKRVKLTVKKLVDLSGIAKTTAEKILTLVTYVDEIRKEEKLLRDKLNDRYVNILLKNYLKLFI